MGKAKNDDATDQTQDPQAPPPGDDQTDGDQPETVAAETPAEPAPPPPWKAPDYCGQLTADQAEWRNRNLKPGVAAQSK